MSKLKIGARLGLAFGLVLLITLGIAAAAIVQLQRLKLANDEMVEHDMQRNELVQAWEGNVRLNLLQVETLMKTSVRADVEKLETDIAAITRETTGIRDRVEKLMDDEASQALLARSVEARQHYLAVRKTLQERKHAGEDVAARVDAELRPLAAAYLASLEAISDETHKALDATLAATQASTGTSQTALGVAALVALTLGAALAVFVTRSITRPIAVAVETAEAIGDGDLSRRVQGDGRDETARLLNALASMQQRLAGIVDDVRRSADSVATASHQIAQGNNDLSGRTEQQASALQQTASAMEELAATVRQNADNAQQANQLAAAASQVATEGGEVVGRVVQTMDGISESSRRIADIIGTIDGIAFQTNILALNAAVEAARAGEQGRGFAVVAGEVRSLAQRSAAAAKEIKDLIGTSVERVESGNALAQQAGAKMTEVLGSIRRVADIVGEISSASAEQSDGVGQVGQAVTEMDQATQQNAALVEESAAAADSLRQQAAHLVETVAVFRLGDATRAAAPADAAAAPVRAAKPVAAAAAPTPSGPVAVGRPAPPKAAARPVAVAAAKPQPRPEPVAAGAEGDWETF